MRDLWFVIVSVFLSLDNGQAEIARINLNAVASESIWTASGTHEDTRKES